MIAVAGTRHDSMGNSTSKKQPTPGGGGGGAAPPAVVEVVDEAEKSPARIQDEANLRLALAMWLDIHLPDVKILIRLMLLGPPVSLRQRPAALLSPGHFHVAVEAFGSGLPLIAQLPVAPTTSVGELKKLISLRLEGRPLMTQVLFAGHGGAQLKGYFTLLSEYGIAAGGVTTVVLGVAVIFDDRSDSVEVCISGLDDTNMDDCS